MLSKDEKKTDQDTEESLERSVEERELAKRRKRASGGVSTVIIVVILIIISTTSFVITSESPGSVSFQTNQISWAKTLLDKSQTFIGFVFNAKKSSSSLNLFYEVHSDMKFLRTSGMCRVPRFLVKGGGIIDHLDVTKLVPSFDPYYHPSFDIYATVCQYRVIPMEPLTIDARTPVYPPLSTYPPPGVFTDQPLTVQGLSDQTAVSVLSLFWSWTEMVSTSPLDLAARFSTKRRVQARLKPEIGTRAVNGSYFYNDGSDTKEYPWPTCDWLSPIQSKFVPTSFHLSYRRDSADNQSYVVSETSLLSWAFSTLVTLGSVIALKSTIANYIDKASHYWRTKQWVRWISFVLYTGLVPLPLLFYVSELYEYGLEYRVRGTGYWYNYISIIIVFVLTGLLIVTWIGVLVRFIYTFRLEKSKRRQRVDECSELIIESNSSDKNAYEEI